MTQSGYTQNLKAIENCIPANGVIRDYLEWAHRTTHTPPIFHLASILPCFAQEVCRQGFTLQFGEDSATRRKMHLWTAVVGSSSSSGKSTAAVKARDFYRAWGSRRFGNEFKEPFLHAEGSVQGVMHSLVEDDYWYPEIQQTVCVLYMEEFARILWQDNGATGFCMLFDGQTFSRNLRSLQKEKETAVIRNPTCSAAFAGTESSLERCVTAEHVEGGLFARLMWFTGNVSPDKLMFTELPQSELKKDAMFSWDAWSKSMLGQQALGREKVIMVDSVSLDLIKDLYFEPYREVLATADRNNSIRMRLLSHIRTVAALYSLSRGYFEIQHEDMLAAINMARLCEQSAIRIMDGLGLDQVIAMRNKVLQCIKDSGIEGLTTSNMYKLLPARIRNKDALSQQLEFLIEVEEIVPVEERSGKQGRPTVRFIAAEHANPDTLDRQH